MAELRAQAPSSRRLLIADLDGTVVGSGMANRSDAIDLGFVAPRVLPEFRHLDAGSALLRALAEHCTGLGLPAVRAHVDEESLAFATRFGFVELGREIEQVRAAGDEQPPSAIPSGVEIATPSQHPGLWEASFETFGKDVLADFALYTPLDVSAAQWNTSWRGDPCSWPCTRGR